MSDDISKIPYLKRLSNATVRTIKLGIALSLLINFAAIVMSLGFAESYNRCVSAQRRLYIRNTDCGFAVRQNSISNRISNVN